MKKKKKKLCKNRICHNIFVYVREYKIMRELVNLCASGFSEDYTRVGRIVHGKCIKYVDSLETSTNAYYRGG